MKGVWSVKPEPKVQPDQLFQNDGQMIIEAYQQSVIIKGKISDFKTIDPVEDLFKNMMRVSCKKIGIQEMTGTVTAPVRTTGRGQ
jgi:hypothetical protein